MVGNDVVDLGDPDVAAPRRSRRFVERVLCAEERAALAASAEPDALLWSLFAAKEAAYKVVSKLRGPVVFAHRRFVVSADLASVHYDGVELSVEVTRGGEWVHALAHAPDERCLWAVERASPGADPSREARRLLCARVAERLGCAAGELDVERAPEPGSWDGFGPPRLVLRGAPAAVDVSLSHAGRFVACAARL